MIFLQTRSVMFATLLAIVAACTSSVLPASETVVAPAPAIDNPRVGGPLQTAVLAGGCFWGVQGLFAHVRGVRRVLAGYSGGDQNSANYSMVSSGRSSHAEAVQITYDPGEISFGAILQIFFSVAHDPTQFNRQGPDYGPQYRSAIFYADATQRKIAQAYIAQLDQARVYSRPIVTRVDALNGFYPAEDYHQDFMVKNPRHPYIVMHDLPKIAALKQVFPADYRDRAMSVFHSNP